ncbi:MAG TPA: Ig-like domain-containing protein, partial [Burkholderiaceae bacterium]|nr:Ig-like domain-containing protein [Burkholderiaceae bacterium]
MHRSPLRRLALACALFVPLAAAADGVSIRNDAADPATTIFPSDRFTVRDWSNITFRRVALPQPDCAVRPSDCADVAVINTLDGFSTQPRITVPFTGDIDPATVNSSTVYLLNLGDTMTMRGFGHRVGINQVLWDPATKTLAFESDELLQEHSRYVLIVTDGVRDSRGKRIQAARDEDDDDRGARGRGHSEYRRDLRDAMRHGQRGRDKVVAATLFTTQSTTADLAKISRQIKASTPAPVDFIAGNDGTGAVRSVFPTAQVLGIQFNRQTGAAPVFTPGFLPTPALGVVPGAVAQIAYGKFRSPDYQTAQK